MKKIGIFAAFVLLLTMLAGASPSHAYTSGPFCGPEQQDITGFGTPSLLGANYDIFIPSLESACPRAANRVRYFSGDEAATFTRMLYRGPDFNTIDLFWARDSVISEAELAQIMTDTGGLRGRYSPVGQFPVAVNGLAVAYNLNCVSKPLNLSILNLSLIYLGQITTWNDPHIVNDQAPDVQDRLKSCNKPIKLTGRADSTGETGTFKGYLASRNPVWTAYLQPQLNTQWPAPLVCRGGSDLGEAGCVASNTGSIGYVTIKRARRQGLRVANVERLRIERRGLSAVDLSSPTTTDPSGVVSGGLPLITPIDFVAPSSQGCTAAADSIQFPPGFNNYSDWNEAPLLNSNDGYPICYFSFIDIFQKPVSAYSPLETPTQALMLRDYMQTVFTERVQKKLLRAGFGPIPDKILAMNRRGVIQIEGDLTCPLPMQPPPLPGVGPVQPYDGLHCFAVELG